MRDIKSFGVSGNGILCETEKINNAIKACAKNNEVLFFPDGIYKTATLFLENNSQIVLSENAEIKASENENDWEEFNRLPLIFAENKENISISGKGKIDCSASAFHDYDGNLSFGNRPDRTIIFKDCRNIKFFDACVSNSVLWTVHFNNCENLEIKNIKIRNEEWWRARCNDGLDINGCRHVKISDCDIEVGDDGICLKNYGFDGLDRKPMFDVKVKNCLIRSTCAPVKIGTETQGDIYDVSFENIEIDDHRKANIYRHPDFGGHNFAAVTINVNDGSFVHDVEFKNIHATYANVGIFFVLQKRHSKVDVPKFGKISNILVDGLKVDHAQRANQINIQDGAIAENITIKNVDIHLFEEGNTFGCVMPEDRWATGTFSFGNMPAYSLYARNVKNLSYFENINVTDEFNTGRPAVIIE